MTLFPSPFESLFKQQPAACVFTENQRFYLIQHILVKHQKQYAWCPQITHKQNNLKSTISLVLQDISLSIVATISLRCLS